METGKSLASILLTVVVSLSGCASQEAAQNVELLQKASLDREEAQWAALEQSIKAYVARTKQAQLDKIEISRLKIEISIRKKVQVREEAEIERVLSEFENLLKPEVDRLETELNQAKERALVSGDNAEELRIAVQLSATLSAYANQSVDFIVKIENLYKEVQKDALIQLAQEFDKARKVVEDESNTIVAGAGKAIEETLTAGRKNSETYKAAIKDGNDEVIRYLKRYKLWADMLKQDTIDDVKKTIFEPIEKEILKFQNKVESKINEVAINSQDFVTDKLNNLEKAGSKAGASL